MKTKWKLLALALCAAMAVLPLSACGEGETPDPDPDNVAMGRYLESQWILPVENANPWGIHKRPDGKIALVIVDDEETMTYYATADGAQWTEESPAWLEQLKPYIYNLNSIHFNVKGRGAVVYFGTAPDSEEPLYRVAIVEPDGALTFTPIGSVSTPAPAESAQIASASVQPEEVDADTASAQAEADTTSAQSEEVDAASAQAEANADEPPLDLAVEDTPEQTAAESDAESTNPEGDAETGAESSDPEGDSETAAEEDIPWFYLSSAFMGEDDLVYGFSFSSVTRYDPVTGEELRTYSDDAAAFAVPGDHVALYLTPSAADIGATLESDAVLFLDPETGEEARRLPADMTRLTGGIVMYSEDGALYMAESSGLYRVTEGGDSWEKIIDGALCTLSSPSSSPYLLIPHGDNEFLVAYSGSDLRLMNYAYDPTVPTMPDKELTVYSLVNNATVSQAIGAFRQQHPDILVSVRTVRDEEGGEEGSYTADDARRALNTELLAGNGPDLLVLDDLPAKSYIEKGVLLDVTDIIEAAIESNDLLSPVLRAYESGGRIHAVPTRFTLPTLWGAPDVLKSSDTLTHLADYAEQNPTKRLFGDMTPSSLLYRLAPAAWPTMVNSDGSLNEEGIARFFTDVNRIAATADTEHAYRYFTDNAGDFPHPWDSLLDPNPEDGFALAHKRAHLITAQLAGFSTVDHPNGAVNAHMGGKTIDESGEGEEWSSTVPDDQVKDVFRLLPGYGDAVVFAPACVVGVNAATDERELCEEFLRTLLSDPVQDADLGDGFPVSRAAIAHNAARQESWYSSHGYNTQGEYPDEEAELTLEFAWPSTAMMAAVGDVLDQVDTPIFMEFSIMEELEYAFATYTGGENTAREAAGQVAERLAIALAE